MNINIENGSIEIDIFELIENMSEEEKRKIVEAVTWDEILKEAVDRLTGESESWESDDSLLTLDVLSKMEEHLLSGYKWSYLEELKQLAKDMTLHEHLYWRMYHDDMPFNHNETYGDIFKKWLDRNGIESNYTHSLDSFKQFEGIVERKLEAMKEE